MPGDKGVVHALARLREAGQAAVLPQGMKTILSPGQQLVHVGLMPDVKYQPILRSVEHTVNGHRELYDPEIGGEVAARLRHVLHQKLPDLLAQQLKLRVVKTAQLLRRSNSIE